MGNANPKTTIDTHKKGKSNTSTTLKMGIKPQEENKRGREEKRPTKTNPKQTVKKMALGKYISIITLSVNRLSAPTKRNRLNEWIQKQDPYICCLSTRDTLQT